MATRKVGNLARMTTATTGTGTITLGSAVTGWLTFAQAGIANTDEVFYGIVDGANREFGWGVYTSSGTTLTRNVINSTNSNNAISLSGSAEVFTAAGAKADGSLDTAGIVNWVQIVTTTGSSTITIPHGASKCKVTLIGGGGSNSGGGGSGASLIKYLSDLTPGLTMSLVVGVGGGSSTDTSLSSGTQSITTLTAARGNSSTGGTATNGDININGNDGFAVSGTSFSGSTLLGRGEVSNVAATGYGSGALSGNGRNGIAIFEWYP